MGEDMRRRSALAAACFITVGALALSTSGDARAKGKKKAVEKTKWGEADGKQVDLYTLTNSKGLIAKITNYGAIVTELHVPDRKGKLADIVLGYDNLADYIKKNPYFGCTVGR